jgi:hypothetical protein
LEENVKKERLKSETWCHQTSCGGQALAIGLGITVVSGVGTYAAIFGRHYIKIRPVEDRPAVW